MTNYAALERRLRAARDRNGEMETLLDDAAYSIGVLSKALDDIANNSMFSDKEAIVKHARAALGARSATADAAPVSGQGDKQP